MTFFDIVVVFSVFAVASATAFLVLPLIRERDADVGVEVGLLSRNVAHRRESETLRKRLSHLKTRVVTEKADVDSETVYFLLLFLLNIQSGLSVSYALKRTYFSLTSMGFKITTYLQEIVTRADSGLPVSQVVKVLEKYPEAKVLREALSGILQAGEFGTPLGESIKTALSTIQERRVIKAEERASKLSVLLAVPIIFGFVPSILIIVGYPAFSETMRVLQRLVR